MLTRFLSIFFSLFLFIFNLSSMQCVRTPGMPADFPSCARAADIFVDVLGTATDINFSIEKRGNNIFRLKIPLVEYANFDVIQQSVPGITLSRSPKNNIHCWLDQADLGVHLRFLFGKSGFIQLDTENFYNTGYKTGVEYGVKFAFQANDVFFCAVPITFHSLAVNSGGVCETESFANIGVIKAREYAFFSPISIQNGGVIDSTAENLEVPLDWDTYVALRRTYFLGEPPKIPRIFDNSGLILGDDLCISGFETIASRGGFCARNLFVNAGKLYVGSVPFKTTPTTPVRFFDVSGTFSGILGTFQIDKGAFINIGTWSVSPNVSLINNGLLHFEQSAKLPSKTQNDSPGVIVCDKELDLSAFAPELIESLLSNFYDSGGYWHKLIQNYICARTGKLLERVVTTKWVHDAPTESTSEEVKNQIALNTEAQANTQKHLQKCRRFTNYNNKLSKRVQDTATAGKTSATAAPAKANPAGNPASSSIPQTVTNKAGHESTAPPLGEGNKNLGEGIMDLRIQEKLNPGKALSSAEIAEQAEYDARLVAFLKKYLKIQKGGHHPLAQSAFKNSSNYKPKKVETILEEGLQAMGIKPCGRKSAHVIVTGNQRFVYKQFEKSGETLTPEIMEKLEAAALFMSGASRAASLDLVEGAMSLLKDKGIDLVLRIPWSKLKPL